MGTSRKRMTFFEGMLLACEGNIAANDGDMKTWEGIAATLLFRRIEHVHGRLWTARTSNHNLEQARKLSAEQPNALLWDSHFIRELVLSAMGGLEIGTFHSQARRAR